MTKPSQALVATWYARLRATGFRDIEIGPKGTLPWTFRSSAHAAGWRSGNGSGQAPSVISWPAGFEPTTLLADHPTAVYHRGLAQAAQVLKGRKRKLILVASEGGAAKASRGLEMSRRTASHQVRRFAVEAGIVREAHGS